MRKVLLGGFLAVGISCFFGSLVSGLWLRISMLNGTPIQQAYASLMAPISLVAWAALVPQAFAGFMGGYVAAEGGQRHLLKGLLAGLVYLAFVAVMYINPESQPPSSWQFLATLVVPIAFALLGGAFRARRT